MKVIDDNDNLSFLKISDPLFIDPTYDRLRYAIMWNGTGRYIPNSLRIYDKINNRYLEKDIEYVEEDNGIFFNFINLIKGNYEDYIVEYKVRPDDYIFSQNINELDKSKQNKLDIKNLDKNYLSEEYFLIPNWLELDGIGDGVWVARHTSSRQDATNSYSGDINIPYSIKGVCGWNNISFKNAKKHIRERGNEYHLFRNREFSNIVYWCNLHGIDEFITGNFNGHKIQIDINKKNPDDKEYEFQHTLTGVGPNTWRHNLKLNGTNDLVGNYLQYIDGITYVPISLNNGNYKINIYTFNENNEYDEFTISNGFDLFNILNDDIIKYSKDNDRHSFNMEYIYDEFDKYRYEAIPISNNSITKNNYNIIKINKNENMNHIFSIQNKINNIFENEKHIILRSSIEYYTGIWSMYLSEMNENGHSEHISFRICKDL